MIEFADKMVIRLIFIAIICISVFAYKYLYQLLAQLLLKEKPSNKNFLNESSLILLFARTIGLALIFSEIDLTLDAGLLFGLISFISKIVATLAMYVFSVIILDAIKLNNFEHASEVVQKNNVLYALVSSSHAIGLGLLIKSLSSIDTHSLVILLILWLFALVILSLSIKGFHFFYPSSLENIVITQNYPGLLNYSSFFIGYSLILSHLVSTELRELHLYFGVVIAKAILCVLLLPFFFFFLKKVFSVHFERQKVQEDHELTFAYGLFHSLNFIASSLLTLACVHNISFGMFYS